jgi:hypothetical protein
MAYAVSRKLTGAGDWEWATTGFAEAPTPATSIVLFVLRTTEGQCGALPGVGVRWPAKLGTNAPQAARTAILAALAEQVRRGVIANLAVETEEQPNGVIAFAVTFDDVRAKARTTVRGIQP